MLGRHFCLAALIAVTVQMVDVQSTVAVVSSICNKVKECYVDESSSKACDRTEKKCNQCLVQKESSSILSTLGVWTEYLCYDVDDNGACPNETTKCPATLKTSTDEEDNSSPKSNDEDDNSSKPDDSDKSATFNATDKNMLSSTSESTNSTSQSSFTPKRATISFASSDSSGSSAPTNVKKLTTKSVTKSYASGNESDVGSFSTSTNTSSRSPHESSIAYAFGGFNSTSQDVAGTSDPEEDETPTQNSISSTVAPAVTTPAAAETRTTDTILSDNSNMSNTARSGSDSGGSKMGLILGIVGGAAAILAFAGFVVWRKKENDTDSDDEDAAFSPTKPAASRNVVSLPSASSATTAYVANPNYYENNKNYEHQYSNAYGNNYGDNGYDKNYTATRYATGASAGASAAGMVPISYDSARSMDIDSENHIRRTDSILGGTGVMSSTTSSMQTPFEFSGGPSPDANQDIWGNEADSFHQKYTASSASVEF